MFIAIKDKKVIFIHEAEWQCRRNAKGISKPEYWEWLESVTTEDVPDYSGEDYEIVEAKVDIQGFQQSGHIALSMEGATTFHLTWDGTTVSADYDAKTAFELDEEWKRIRTERTRLLAETDWVVIKARENGGQVPTAWKTYRVALRDLPAEQSDKTKYSEITWPTQPS